MNENLQYSGQGIALTKRAETSNADFLTAYWDAHGKVWTIGIGHTKGVKQGDVITVEQQAQLLIDDVADAVAAVKRLVTVPLNQWQFDALVDLVFNIGETQFASSALLRVLNLKQYAAASAQFPVWNKSGNEVLAGLVSRRAACKALFDFGNYIGMVS